MPAIPTADTPEVELLTSGMRRGEQTAWTDFHRSHHLGLLRYAIHLAPRIDADEVCQLVYLRVSRHIKVFRHDGDFRRWLCCVVRCVVIDLQRERTRRNFLAERFSLWLEHRRPAASRPGPDDVAGRLRDIVHRLPEEDARLLEKKYLEGWTTAELAAELSCSVKAVESRLARLRAQLKHKLLKDDSHV